jgi:hypothetical protein
MSGPPNPETAFCVVEAQYSFDHPYVLAHEIGHLQNAQHETGSPLARPYAKAFCHYSSDKPENHFGTIMCTYSSNPIPYFSNPDILYAPTPTDSFWIGDMWHNNSRRINETALIVASHRGDIVVPVAVSDFEARVVDGVIKLGWRVSVERQDELAGVHVQRAEHSEGPYIERTSVPLRPAGVMSWADPEVILGRTYWYRLRLVGEQGGADVVGPLTVTVASEHRPLQVLGTKDDQIRIRYSVGPEAADVRLDLYDARGRLVSVLEQALHAPGDHVVTWNRRTSSGVRVGRGVYWLQLRVGRDISSAKLVLLQG